MNWESRPTVPFPGGRTRPDGQVLKWETAGIGPGSRGDVLPFLIQDYTAHKLRVQPSPSVHGSALSGIAIVVIGVKDMTAAIALFRKAYGWKEPITEEHKDLNAKLAYFAGTPVVLANRPRAMAGGPKTGEIRRRSGSGFGGAADWKAAAEAFPLSGETVWFGREVAWFDPEKLQNLKIGVIAPVQ